MTKSIKEKTRLAEIKKHQLNETSITYDLLKVKLSFKLSYPKKYLDEELPDKIFRTFYNENWLREQFQEILKKDIKLMLINIARTLEIYEFKVYFTINVITYPEHTAKVDVVLRDKFNNRFGKILLNTNLLSNSLFSYPLTNTTPIEVCKQIKIDMEQLSTNVPYSMTFFDNAIEKRLKMYKNKNFHETIIKNSSFQSSYLRELGFKPLRGFKNLNIFLSSFIIDNKINHLTINHRAGHTKSYMHTYKKDMTKFDIIKMLFCFRHIDIPPEDMKFENLDAIEGLIKMRNY